MRVKWSPFLSSVSSGLSKTASIYSHLFNYFTSVVFVPLKTATLTLQLSGGISVGLVRLAGGRGNGSDLEERRDLESDSRYSNDISSWWAKAEEARRRARHSREEKKQASLILFRISIVLTALGKQNYSNLGFLIWGCTLMIIFLVCIIIKWQHLQSPIQQHFALQRSLLSILPCEKALTSEFNSSSLDHRYIYDRTW